MAALYAESMRRKAAAFYAGVLLYLFTVGCCYATFTGDRRVARADHGRCVSAIQQADHRGIVTLACCHSLRGDPLDLLQFLAAE
jgi:hypothetical protein